jgi:hypothetical protein
MALPPKGDPRRPLHLAIRSARILGIVCVLAGAGLAMPVVLQRFGRCRGIFAPTWFVLAGCLFYLLPGTLFLVFAVFMKRRRTWAVVGALATASLIALLLVVAAVAILVAVVAEGEAWAIPVFSVIAVWAASELAVGQLIFQLAHSFAAIKHQPFGRDDARGFETLPAKFVQATIIGPAPFAPAPPQPATDPADGRDTTYDPAAPR